MGGRGSISGFTNSSEYKRAYDLEMENAKDFEASYALEPTSTMDAIGYQMYVHRESTGHSLIADTQAEIDELQRALRSATRDGESYGMTKLQISGLKDAICEKIKLRERAIERMSEARSEYEKYRSQANTGRQKSAKRKGKWM